MSPSCHRPSKSITGHTSSDVCAKRRQEPNEEDTPETTIIKVQKLTKHEGRPHARDYDDITQEFVNAAIRDYQACLCAENPMPDHAQETALLNASWAKVVQTTGINLVWMPQRTKLVSAIPTVSVLYFQFNIGHQLWLASSWQAQGQAPPSHGSHVQFSQQPNQICDQEESCNSGRVKRGCEFRI